MKNERHAENCNYGNKRSYTEVFAVHEASFSFVTSPSLIVSSFQKFISNSIPRQKVLILHTLRALVAVVCTLPLLPDLQHALEFHHKLVENGAG